MQGHYAILFAKALGCEVYAFSHSSNKEKDCKEMGVDHYVLDSPGFHDRYSTLFYRYNSYLDISILSLQYALDIIICTRDAVDGFPLQEYLS